MGENEKGKWMDAIISVAILLIGVIIGIFVGSLFNNNKAEFAVGEGFSSEVPKVPEGGKWPIFANPKYALGPSSRGISSIFANPAYGTASDRLMGIIPVPTDLMEWNMPNEMNKAVRKDELSNSSNPQLSNSSNPQLSNSFGPMDEKSVMNVNGKLGVKWLDDNHYKSAWGDTHCVSCDGANRHLKKKEPMLNPGVYDQGLGPDEAPIRSTHVIPTYYYQDEWKSRFRRNVWDY